MAEQVEIHDEFEWKRVGCFEVRMSLPFSMLTSIRSRFIAPTKWPTDKYVVEYRRHCLFQSGIFHASNIDVTYTRARFLFGISWRTVFALHLSAFKRKLLLKALSARNERVVELFSQSRRRQNLMRLFGCGSKMAFRFGRLIGGEIDVFDWRSAKFCRFDDDALKCQEGLSFSHD